MGARVSLTLACSSYSFPPVGLPCLASVWGIFTLFYCILFCGLWLLSLGGLLFFWKEAEGEWNWEREEVGSSRDRGNCGSDILYQRRMFSRKKKSKVHSVINFHKCIPILPGLNTIDSSLKTSILFCSHPFLSPSSYGIQPRWLLSSGALPSLLCHIIGTTQ